MNGAEQGLLFLTFSWATSKHHHGVGEYQQDGNTAAWADAVMWMIQNKVYFSSFFWGGGGDGARWVSISIMNFDTDLVILIELGNISRLTDTPEFKRPLTQSKREFLDARIHSR